jgi:uncharacterized membrane protein YeaQ/YmgE (transglycosylase-associated protein family)
MGLVVMLAIWVVIGVLIAALAPNIFKGERPYGDTTDYIVAIVATVITGLGDWYILPAINIEGALRFVAALIEPPLAALVVLWVMRYWKRRQA